MAMKYRALLIIFCFILISSCGEGGSLASRSTSTPEWSSCGVGLTDHNVRIWLECNYAEEACGMIVASEKADLESPMWRNATRVSSSDGYFVVCSDEFSDLVYEVVDTGGAMYGSGWCRMVTNRFGTAPYPVEPDMFGLIGP